jgi:hypothetical protein
MSRVFIVLTSGTTWIAPADCATTITVECISGGAWAHGTDSNTNGSYSKSNSITVTPFQKFYYQVGAAESSTWFNKTASIPTAGINTTADSCKAYTGGGVTQSDQITNSVGDIKYYGGSCNFIYTYRGASDDSFDYYGAGGAAGPDGNGGDASGLYGGGANGGTSATPSISGNGPLNNTDGTNGAPPLITMPPITSSQYLVWRDYLNNDYGISSGFSATAVYNNASPQINTVGYGGTGKQGLIVISYVPISVPKNQYTEVYQGPVNFAWRCPPGVSSIKVEALGAGASTTFAFPSYSGGGGAYAANTISVSQGDIFLANVGGTAFPTAGNTSFSSFSTNIKYVEAGGGTAGSTSGAGGTVVAGTGFPGGAGAPSYGTTTSNMHTGGGGGAGGPNGPGGDGGLSYGLTNGTSGGGGGGGGAGLIGSPVTLAPTSLASNGSLYFTIPSGKTIIPGTTITVSGGFGSGGLAGYSNPTNYYVRSTNGSTVANLCLTFAGTTITAPGPTTFGSVVFTISNRGGVGGLTGGASSANFGGAGGSGAFRDPGGSGGSTTANGTIGINGSGGGGGGLNATFAAGLKGGDAQIYSTTISNTAIGFFISGGSGGNAGSSTIGASSPSPLYGGGAAVSTNFVSTPGGTGLLAITYTVTENTNASESSMLSMF